MNSRRELKKKLKNSTNELIEDGFMESINGDSKERDKMEKLIDGVVDYRVNLLNKISNYPRHAKRSQIKKHFGDIKSEMDKNKKDFTKKIGHVS